MTAKEEGRSTLEAWPQKGRVQEVIRWKGRGRRFIQYCSASPRGEGGEAMRSALQNLERASLARTKPLVLLWEKGVYLQPLLTSKRSKKKTKPDSRSYSRQGKIRRASKGHSAGEENGGRQTIVTEGKVPKEGSKKTWSAIRGEEVAFLGGGTPIKLGGGRSARGKRRSGGTHYLSTGRLGSLFHGKKGGRTL